MSGTTTSYALEHRHRVVLSLTATFVVHLGILYAASMIFERYAHVGFGHRWFVAAVLVWLYEGWRIHGALRGQWEQDYDGLRPGLGAANHLTLCRGLFVCGLSGFLSAGRLSGVMGWIPGVIYLTVIIIDHFDGYVARLQFRTSRFGERLDRDLDALGMLVGSLLVVRYSQAPIWFVVTGAAYYAFVAGLWVRAKRSAPTRELPPSLSRRMIASCQMGTVAVLLLPVLRPPVTILAAAVFTAPFLARFLWDWLVVSCRVPDPSEASGTMRGMLHRRLPFIWRAAACLAVAGLMARDRLIPSPAERVILPIDWIPGGSMALTALSGIAAILFAVGALGRVASLVLLITVTISASLNGLDWLYGAAFAASALGVVFGTGGLSLWRADEPWFLEYAGKRRDDTEKSSRAKKHRPDSPHNRSIPHNLRR